MLYLTIIVTMLAIAFIYWTSLPDDTQSSVDIAWGIPNWQPTVCDPFYQNCCSNPRWTYSDGYFYPIFVKNT